MKKIILLLIFVFCSIGSITISAATYGDLTYEITDGKVRITDCDTSASGELTIPAEIESCPVTTIGRAAFEECTGLTGITIPDSVTFIDGYAFYNCTGLININIPDGIICIDNYTFSGCNSLTSITIPDSVIEIGDWAFTHCASITSISIPDSVTYIGISAFAGCENLTDVSIGNGVTYIEGNTFGGCKNLISVNIPDSVTTISYEVFYFCENLTDVTIGKGLTSLSDSAFSHCYSLKNIKVDENNPAFTDIDGVLFSKDKKNLVRYPCKRYGNYNIPDGVTSVKSQAFAYCYNLKSITIPDSVTFIVPGAFYGSYLKKVYKPVTATWEYSFDKNVEIIPVYKVTYKLYDEIIAAEYAELNQKANLLTSPDRYRYGYTVNGQKWDGVVKDNTIVTVTLLPKPIVSLIPEIVLQAESIKENSIHCIYKINVESDMALTGNFIIGIYDSSNRLVAHETHTITDKTEYFAEGVIESDVKATTYKIFLWRDLSELETLSPVLEGTIQ